MLPKFFLPCRDLSFLGNPKCILQITERQEISEIFRYMGGHHISFGKITRATDPGEIAVLFAYK